MSVQINTSSVLPLSEANLNRYTLQSLASRESKKKHILVYVDGQRELNSLGEDFDENNNTVNMQHSGQSPTHNLNTTGSRQMRTDTVPQNYQHQHTVSRRIQELKERSGYRDTPTPDALDPSIALPRALPRSTIPPHSSYEPHIHDRDSFCSGIGLEDEGCLLEGQENYISWSSAGHCHSPNTDGYKPVKTRRGYYDVYMDTKLRKQALTRQQAIVQSTEKGKKTLRLSLFPFLNKGRQSLPVESKAAKRCVGEDEEGEGGPCVVPSEEQKRSLRSRSRSMPSSIRKAFEAGEKSKTMIDNQLRTTIDRSKSTPMAAVNINPSASGVTIKRSKSKVKQLLLDVFKSASKTNQGSPVDSSLPLKRRPGYEDEIAATSMAMVPHEMSRRSSTSPLDSMFKSLLGPEKQDQERSIQQRSDSKKMIRRSRSIDSVCGYGHQTSLAPPPASFVLRHPNLTDNFYSNNSSFASGYYYDTLGPGFANSRHQCPAEMAMALAEQSTEFGDVERYDPDNSGGPMAPVAPEQQRMDRGGNELRPQQNTFGITVAVV
ncbi:hypothetical protein BGX28_004456 [Mortierella sp. GBA30]|nr:hypothetical protein BGX28_004456 [Mortierella sp. GBA30]